MKQEPNDSNDYRARTSGWDAETETLAGSGAPKTWQPSRSALAAQSLRKAQRTSGTDERRAAFSAHLDQYPPLIGR